MLRALTLGVETTHRACALLLCTLLFAGCNSKSSSPGPDRITLPHRDGSPALDNTFADAGISLTTNADGEATTCDPYAFPPLDGR